MNSGARDGAGRRRAVCYSSVVAVATSAWWRRMTVAVTARVPHNTPSRYNAVSRISPLSGYAVYPPLSVVDGDGGALPTFGGAQKRHYGFA
jgi:hypothetical protein